MFGSSTETQKLPANDQEREDSRASKTAVRDRGWKRHIPLILSAGREVTNPSILQCTRAIMSLDFGTGQILTAIQLCYQVYARCQSSRGEFKSLSIQTHTIREILQIIESRRSNMTAQNYATLQPIVDRLVQLLRETTRRLTEYHSLGTATPGVWDKMRWAMDGGSKEVRAELDSLLGQLTAINTRYA